MKCPRCDSDKLDYLRNKYGRSIDMALYGDCDYRCRECDCTFKEVEGK